MRCLVKFRTFSYHEHPFLLVKVYFQLFFPGYNQYNSQSYNFITMKSNSWLTGKRDK